MKKFITVNYTVHNSKMKPSSHARFTMLTDLHGLVFGEDNSELLKSIEESRPDAVLVTGDMIVRSDENTMGPAEKLLLQIVNHFPVYYSLGNHESKIAECENSSRQYLEYEKRLQEAGVRFLHNESEILDIRGNRFTFHGLELPMEYYKKPKSPRLEKEIVDNLIGRPEGNGIHVLLAHNPKYGHTYLRWGADLILSGHYHGGVVRLGKHTGLTSPQFLLFPPFCVGDFYKDNKCMVVSAGLGEHTIPVRIHNPRELLVIDMEP